ncbi:MAG: hypothetical protein AAFQ98_13890, partial [Bacteroidota bacterium]
CTTAYGQPPNSTPPEPYQWHPTADADGVLILFPGFGQPAENILEEFPVLEAAQQEGYSVLLFNFNRRLWLSAEETEYLARLTSQLLEKENQPTQNVVIGGYSSGGNVALLFCQFLVANQQTVQPQGVFVVDSPVDLQQLYDHATLAVERNVAQPAVSEGQYLKQLFHNTLGTPSKDLARYEQASPYTYSTANITNIGALQTISVRLYTEPDLQWWKEERGVQSLSETNSGTLLQLQQTLSKNHGWQNISYESTSGKGYRADGTRHPHSWSIVDVEDLLEWMKSISTH